MTLPSKLPPVPTQIVCPLNWFLVSQFGAFLRSLVDADEHRMAERLLRQIQKYNIQACRICQKHFWSMDHTIKV
jgi:hypothetical protein